MKKLLILAAALAGAICLNKKWRKSKVVKTTWSRATDSVN
ncbi:DLW-39 family protein [Specibacter sp. AOP5-B1-6]